MENIKKKSLNILVIVFAINMAILILCDFGINILLYKIHNINPIFIYFSVPFFIVLFIEVILFILRKKEGIKFKYYRNKNDSSNADLTGMWWALFTWIFPIILYRLIIWKFDLHIFLQLPGTEGAPNLGNIVVPYVAFRTFLEWQIYRQFFDRKSPWNAEQPSD